MKLDNRDDWVENRYSGKGKRGIKDIAKISVDQPVSYSKRHSIKDLAIDMPTFTPIDSIITSRNRHSKTADYEFSPKNWIWNNPQKYTKPRIEDELNYVRATMDLVPYERIYKTHDISPLRTPQGEATLVNKSMLAPHSQKLISKMKAREARMRFDKFVHGDALTNTISNKRNHNEAMRRQLLFETRTQGIKSRETRTAFNRLNRVVEKPGYQQEKITYINKGVVKDKDAGRARADTAGIATIKQIMITMGDMIKTKTVDNIDESRHPLPSSINDQVKTYMNKAKDKHRKHVLKTPEEEQLKTESIKPAIQLSSRLPLRINYRIVDEFKNVRKREIAEKQKFFKKDVVKHLRYLRKSTNEFRVLGDVRRLPDGWLDMQRFTVNPDKVYIGDLNIIRSENCSVLRDSHLASFNSSAAN